MQWIFYSDNHFFVKLRWWAGISFTYQKISKTSFLFAIYQTGLREDTTKVSVLRRVFEEGSFRRAEAQNDDESRAPKRIRTSYRRTGNKEVI